MENEWLDIPDKPGWWWRNINGGPSTLVDVRYPVGWGVDPGVKYKFLCDEAPTPPKTIEPGRYKCDFRGVPSVMVVYKKHARVISISDVYSIQSPAIPLPDHVTNIERID